MSRESEAFGWLGLVSVIAMDASGHVFFRRRFKNHITDAGLNLAANALVGTETDLRVRYIAFGTGTAAPTDADTKLAAEQYRKTFLVQTRSGIGQMYTQVFLSSDEANFHIQELGWFATESANTNADSGVLIARTLFDFDKTAGVSVFLDRTDTIGRL